MRFFATPLVGGAIKRVHMTGMEIPLDVGAAPRSGNTVRLLFVCCSRTQRPVAGQLFFAKN